MSLQTAVGEVFAGLQRWKALLVSRPQPPECQYVVCHNDLCGVPLRAVCIDPRFETEGRGFRSVRPGQGKFCRTLNPESKSRFNLRYNPIQGRLSFSSDAATAAVKNSSLPTTVVSPPFDNYAARRP